LTAAAIMLLPALVILLASGLWWLVERGHIDLLGMLGSSNKGTLVSPVRDMREVSLFDQAGQTVDYFNQDPHWTLLIPGSGHCAEGCRETLWLTRQLHTALGRRARHLQRIYLVDRLPLDGDTADYLGSEHPGLQVLHASAADSERLLGGTETLAGPPPAFYLVDKRGFLMMYYTAENSGRDVIADLKFLMKQVGDD
jgi:cytochrome oxidase Cu insertion factor (SCO1/SenC/PrrC family)